MDHFLIAFNRLCVLMDLYSAILKQYGGLPLDPKTYQTLANLISM